MNELQKKTANAIVNIFETGTVFGKYGKVTLLQGDTGHLTYGRSQTTLGSGNLALLIHDYCQADGALSADLEPFLSALDRRDVKLDANDKLKSLLRAAGDDPVMQSVQDAFFDRVYWAPSTTAARRISLSLALGISVVYDSHIHGSFGLIRDMTTDTYGSVQSLGEEDWIQRYVATRKSWLANHTREDLHPTVYRMDAFKELIDEEKWELELPLTVRGVVVSGETLSARYQQPVIVSADEGAIRVLMLARPRMRGEDVQQLQRALGFADEAVDGVFGPDTDGAVRAFQKKKGLKIDGKVGPATRSALGIG